MNPVELGYFEKSPGLWGHPDKGRKTFEIRECANPECRADFMGVREPGRGRFCSLGCIRRKADAGYFGRHFRVHRARGPANEQSCVDCGQQAEHWSQIHGTSGEDPQDYEPRCAKCHRRYDAETQARGEDVGGAVLTEARVRGIRASVGATLKELGEIHGVSLSTIHLIRKGKTWRHVK